MTANTYCKQLLKTAQRQANRQVFVLSGEWSWTFAQIEGVLPLLEHVLWMGEHAPDTCHSEPVDAGKHLLGSEFQHIVFNAFSGFHPTSFSAAMGCIPAGGLLVLLCPALDTWHTMVDPDYQRMRVWGCEPGSQYFIRRIAASLVNNGQFSVYQQGHKFLNKAQKQDIETKSITPINLPFKTQCQYKAYKAIVNVALGRRRRPLLLNAKRGRGKSVALGLAANYLIKEQAKKIIITAPSFAALKQVFAFIDETNRSSIEYYSPDAMMRLAPEADAVLVDEAAGIPVPLLKQWLKRYPRIVFSSTSYGYEGHGQGFMHRFGHFLQQSCPQHKKLTLEEAIRWQTPCPLESWLDNTLLLDCELEYLDKPVTQILSPSYKTISQQKLSEDKHLLKQVYGLLLSAHYQTTPDDLRIILDAANIRLSIAMHDNHVIGVVMYAEEGRLPESLHDDICAAKRRLPGHLAPQLIAATTATTQVLSEKTWRIVRIAVAEPCRRQSIGKGLLNFIEQQARKHHIDALTSCFGFTAEVLGFWQAEHYVPVAMSARQDSVSGAFSGVVYKALNHRAQTNLNELAEQFTGQLAFSLSDYLQRIPIETVTVMINMLANTPKLSEQEVRILHLFASGNKSLESSLVALGQFALLGHKEDDPRYAILLLRVLLKWPLEDIVKQTEITGRSQLLDTLRGFVKDQLQCF